MFQRSTNMAEQPCIGLQAGGICPVARFADSINMLSRSALTREQQLLLEWRADPSSRLYKGGGKGRTALVTALQILDLQPMCSALPPRRAASTGPPATATWTCAIGW